MKKDVDVIIDSLDLKWGCGEWDFYRAGSLKWVGQVRGKILHPEPIAVDLLSECLSMLLSCREVVAVPPAPRLGVWTVGKDGAKWCLLLDGHACAYGIRSKAEATLLASKAQERDSASIAEWQAKWGPFVATHVQGVDYIYRS